jgi:hypothetical protein
LSIQSPIPAQQFRTEAPLIKSAGLGGWQNEFMRQRSSASTPVSLGKQAVRDAPQVNTYQTTMSYPQPMYQTYTNAFQQQMDQPMTQQADVSVAQHVQMSDVDFEAAFSEALAHAEVMDHDRQSTPAMTETPAIQSSDHIRIGSDALKYVEKADRTADLDSKDADELARTAGQLLHNVSHDTSDKFANSRFLELMRKIRDREVEVQNNDLKDTNTAQPVSEVHQTTLPVEQTELPSSHFSFPDMDAVYAPTNTDTAWSDNDPSDSSTARQYINPGGRFIPTTGAQAYAHFDDAIYGYDDDIGSPQLQGPATQMEALHPGGKYYPEQSPRLQRADMEMSGAVNGDDTTGMDRRTGAGDDDLAKRLGRGPEMGSY